MPEFPGRDGEPIFIADGGIGRFRHINPDSPSEGSYIDFGSSSLLTTVPFDGVLKMLGRDNFPLFTTIGGAVVAINKKFVTSFRTAQPTNGDGTDITLGGRYQHVVEDYAQVKSALGLKKTPTGV